MVGVRSRKRCTGSNVTSMRVFALVFAIAGMRSGQTTHGSMFPPVRGTHADGGRRQQPGGRGGHRASWTQGGNAVDAGVATALAAAITEIDHFGLGGEMPMLVKMAGKPVSPSAESAPRPRGDGRVLRTSPAGAMGRDRPMPPIPGQWHSRGHRSRRVRRPDSGAPEVRHHVASRRSSTPALEYAEQGSPSTEIFASFIHATRTISRFGPTSIAFFLPQAGAQAGRALSRTRHGAHAA